MLENNGRAGRLDCTFCRFVLRMFAFGGSISPKSTPYVLLSRGGSVMGDIDGIGSDVPEANSEGGYFGHMTMADGSHVALSADEAKALWDATGQARAKTEADFPDEQATLREMCRAHHRMRDFGWRDGIYCPKDGSEFEIIEGGSTGVFRCRYDGEWPDGMWMTFADGDVYPSIRPPLMFRLLPEAQAEYDRKMAEASARIQAGG